MFSKVGLLFLTILAGSYALPLEDEQDMSIFFHHSDSSSRIIGGTQAGSVPHMVALTSSEYRSLICGASLISNRHVLTAGHCIDAAFYRGALMTTLRGTVGSNLWNSGGFQYTFTRNITHPNFVAQELKNDIGILVTRNTVAMIYDIRAVPLNYDVIGANVPVRVNGWGLTAAGGSLSETLLELRANTVDGNYCIDEVSRRAKELNIEVPTVQPHIEICIFVGANQGTCHGDSGSALVLQDSGEQIGVVSWGLPCAQGAPDMFARVSAYQSWIKGIIN